MCTSATVDADAETVWRQIIMYEDVPTGAPFPLSLLVPRPLRTVGDKTRPGALVRCAYDGGHLVKRIGTVRKPRLIRFDVIEQQLGIERFVTLLGGSYELYSRGAGTEIVLTTRYFGRLRPRRLVRPLEQWLASQLHRHIIDGMRAEIAHAEKPAYFPAGNDGKQAAPRWGVPCTTLHSHSHHR